MYDFHRKHLHRISTPKHKSKHNSSHRVWTALCCCVVCLFVLSQPAVTFDLRLNITATTRALNKNQFWLQPPLMHPLHWNMLLFYNSICSYILSVCITSPWSKALSCSPNRNASWLTQCREKRIEAISIEWKQVPSTSSRTYHTTLTCRTPLTF